MIKPANQDITRIVVRKPDGPAPDLYRIFLECGCQIAAFPVYC
jgi:hypothetical protein